MSHFWCCLFIFFFFFSSRRRHTRLQGDWSSDVCSSDLSKWFDLYHQKTGIEINYQSIGSGAGIQQVKAGTVDFGASDAPLSNAQLKDMPRRVVHIPTVAGAVALAYNLPGMDQPLRLTSDVITAIYLGKITMWNDKR